MPATRLVQIRLPLKEHRALANEAKRTGRTLTGQVRLMLGNHQNHQRTILELFTRFTTLTDMLLATNEHPEDATKIMKDIKQLLSTLSESTC